MQWIGWKKGSGPRHTGQAEKQPRQPSLPGGQRNPSAVDRVFHMGRTLFAIGAFLVGPGLWETTGAQEIEWSIDSPLEGQVFQGDVRSIDVYLRKPTTSEAMLRITFTDGQGGGEASNLTVGNNHFEILTLHKNGKRFPDGDYRLELYADIDLDRLMDKVDFKVSGNEHAVNLPTIEFPYHGQTFPAGINRIRFSGKSPCPTYLALKKALKPILVSTVEPGENMLWKIDIPWAYGHGGFSADLFLYDPAAFKQVAEDGTTFDVLGGELQILPTDWKSFTPIQR